jgi:hypothetical protein
MIWCRNGKQWFVFFFFFDFLCKFQFRVAEPGKKRPPPPKEAEGGIRQLVFLLSARVVAVGGGGDVDDQPERTGRWRDGQRQHERGFTRGDNN